MGQARNRGTREERVAQAQAAGRKPGAPERTTSYAPRPVIRTPMLDHLWNQYKIIGDVTVGEIRAQAIAEQQRLAAERAAQEQTAVSDA